MDRVRCNIRGGAALVCFALAIATVNAAHAGAVNPNKQMEDPEVRVIGIAPLPVQGMDPERFPGNAWSVSSEELEQFQSIEIADGLTKRLGSFSINAAQNNPYQNDVFYRGFLVSPLVGTANGLSIYFDGVRINEGFGGTLNWDLIPESAVAVIDVIPGSNPVFGRNTLGGAVSVRTKSGATHPGTRMEANYGSFDRRAVEFEYGGSRGELDWYVNFDGLDENGWRDASPTEIRRVFGKLGWENDISDIDLSFSRASNDLLGNGLALESSLSRYGRESVYTQPDQTLNDVNFFNLSASHLATDKLQVAANFYRRDYERTTVNGDVEIECEATATVGDREFGISLESDGFQLEAIGDDADSEEEEEEGGLHLALCNEARLRAASNNLDAAIDDLLVAEPGLAPDSTLDELELEYETGGELRNTLTDTEGTGGTVQLSHTGPIAGWDNTLTIGFAYDHYKTRYTLREVASEVGGSARAPMVAQRSLADVEPTVDVRTEEDSMGLYVHDTVDVSDALGLTLSARYQYVDVSIRELRELAEDEEDRVSGDHSFSRISPAVGLNYQAMPEFTVFASYSEGFRTPTAAELTCADEDAPCTLPNAFLSDPPLDPVVARTYELGARGHLPVLDDMDWHLALFRTDLKDDLFFTHTRATGAGFFQNIGDTRRQGLELGLSGQHDRLDFFASYAYLEATIESNVTLSNAARFEGTQVKAGSTLPGIPRHNLRFGGTWLVFPNWVIGTNVRVVGSSYFRGNEGNQGIQNLRGEHLNGKVDGYAVWDLNTVVELSDNIEIWGKLENVLDTDYETAGVYNFNANLDGSGEIDIGRFVAPGAPRAGWLGLSVTF